MQEGKRKGFRRIGDLIASLVHGFLVICAREAVYEMKLSQASIPLRPGNTNGWQRKLIAILTHKGQCMPGLCLRDVAVSGAFQVSSGNDDTPGRGERLINIVKELVLHGHPIKGLQ